MKLRPLHDYVLIRREKPQEVTAGGIILPPTGQKNAHTGEVLAVGPGRYQEDGTRRPVGVEPGQVVCFQAFSDQTIRVDGEDLVMLRADDIQGIVER